MRAIDVHIDPMNPAYVEASTPFMPAAQRMFKGKFEARPDSQIAEDGAAGGIYANEALAALTRMSSFPAGPWSIPGATGSEGNRVVARLPVIVRKSNDRSGGPCLPSSSPDLIRRSPQTPASVGITRIKSRHEDEKNLLLS